MALQVAEGDETPIAYGTEQQDSVRFPESPGSPGSPELPDSSSFIDVSAPSFRFDDRRLRAARAEGQLLDCVYGPVVCDHATVGRLLRQPTLVHDPWRQLRCSGVTDHAIGSWFASLLIFSRAEDHDALRQSMRPLLRGPAFDPSFAAAQALAATAELDGECEFVADVADSIVLAQAARLLDIDGETYREIAQPVQDLALIHRLMPLETLAQAKAAVEQVQDFLGRLARREGVLAAERTDWTRSRMSLLIGFEPYRLALGQMVAVLADHPRAWSAAADDETIAESAVRELLRWMPTAPIQIRFTERPLTLADRTLEPGRPVLLCAVQANRDAEPDGDIYRPLRVPSRPHLSFGAGLHYCIGATASERQLAAVLCALAARFRVPELTGEVRWGPPSGVQGPVEVPVRLTRRPRASWKDGPCPSL
ncbi:cytochrome P450 [Streptomyces pseudovenezuelae]|uniref:Cytochrome P450 n=1 Tax=Streptomyces pseudovenezuelae TaxID=67350 RepID=A0ABT6LNH5_9ACTN|nr:cytochrome P450 [Streptomyces pseudovenezuelae]MDH6217812.1 cytochrome P450 [Streptomyces pseudovenezuelae]